MADRHINRFNTITRTQHRTDLLTVILDDAPDAVYAEPEPWEPERQPGDGELIAQALRERAVSPYEIFRSARSAARAPQRLIENLRTLGTGAGTLASVVSPNEESSLNGPIGPHRRWGWATTSLADVKTIRKALGGTVNDVVLTVITKGFRELLLYRGEEVEGRVVRTLVPVSVRKEDERGTLNNRVSAMFAELPVGIEDPRKRLESIREQMEGLKEKKQAVAAEALTSLAGFAPPELLALGGRLFARVNQRNVQTVTTNVPGPQKPMYACGRRMLSAMPYVPLAGSVRIGIAIFSYAGQLNYGVTGEFDTTPDLDVLCHGIEEGMDELLKLVA